MSHHRLRWHRFWLGLCAIPFLFADAPVAVAAKIKMAFPGPVTTFSLPYLVAQKKGWMDGLEVDPRRRQYPRRPLLAADR